MHRRITIALLAVFLLSLSLGTALAQTERFLKSLPGLLVNFLETGGLRSTQIQNTIQRYTSQSMCLLSATIRMDVPAQNPLLPPCLLIRTIEAILLPSII